jgi:hypothetical protein
MPKSERNFMPLGRDKITLKDVIALFFYWYNFSKKHNPKFKIKK